VTRLRAALSRHGGRLALTVAYVGGSKSSYVRTELGTNRLPAPMRRPSTVVARFARHAAIVAGVTGPSLRLVQTTKSPYPTWTGTIFAWV
jgi:hypothetical protein